MPTWPVSLPQKPLEKAYEETMRPSQVRSSIEGLPIVQRQRSSGYAKPVILTMELTNTQYNDFQDFFRNDLGFGAIPFTWTHPRTNVIVRVRFVGGQVPKAAPMGFDTYHLACSAELMP